MFNKLIFIRSLKLHCDNCHTVRSIKFSITDNLEFFKHLLILLRSLLKFNSRKIRYFIVIILYKYVKLLRDIKERRIISSTFNLNVRILSLSLSLSLISFLRNDQFDHGNMKVISSLKCVRRFFNYLIRSRVSLVSMIASTIVIFDWQ